METQGLAGLLGLLVPLLVAIVVRLHTSSAVKGTLAAVFSVAVGAAVVFLQGEPAVEKLATTIITVIVAAQASYTMFWKPRGVSTWLMEHFGNVEG